jgi:hypothetical protein
MPRQFKLLIMILFAFVVSWLITPSGDPSTLFVHTVAILCIAVPSYLTGVREGRGETRIAGSNTTRDAANKE